MPNTRSESPSDAIQTLVQMVESIAEVLCWLEVPKHVVEDEATK